MAISGQAAHQTAVANLNRVKDFFALFQKSNIFFPFHKILSKYLVTYLVTK
jgi:hypothetical protein